MYNSDFIKKKKTAITKSPKQKLNEMAKKKQIKVTPGRAHKLLSKRCTATNSKIGLPLALAQIPFSSSFHLGKKVVWH